MATETGDLLERWCGHGYPREVGGALLDKYAEPHRHYHTADHLRSMFRLLETDPSAQETFAQLSPTDRTTVELALWYHDREYNPKSSDNELKSAVQFLGDCVQMDVPELVRKRVVHLILLSRSHQPAAGDLAAAVFCDLDLSILGSDPDVYDQYALAIREEYATVPMEYYRAGRRRVLQAFLSRARLFRCIRRLEPMARANLARELDRWDRTPVWRLPWNVLGPLAALIGMIIMGFVLPVPGGLSITFVFVGLLSGIGVLGRRAGRSHVEAVEHSVRQGNLLLPDLPRRVRLWSALSYFYLDTQIDDDLMARDLQSTGYSADEARQAMGEDVGPVVGGNLGWGVFVAYGEWAGFDTDWLRTEILMRRHARRSESSMHIEAFLSTWFVRKHFERIVKLAMVTR